MSSASNPFEIFSTNLNNSSNSSTSRSIVMPGAHLYEEILESVLLSTIDEQSDISAVYLNDLAHATRQHWDKNLIEQALFERLHLADPMIHCLNQKQTVKGAELQSITEKRALFYLAGCYQRLIRQRQHFSAVFQEMQELFLDHCKTAINLPDMYEGQDLPKQWFDLLVESFDNSHLSNFIDQIHDGLFSNSSGEDLQPFYSEVFRHLARAIQPLDYFSSDVMSYIALLIRMAKYPMIVQILFRLSDPKNLPRQYGLSNSKGRAYEETLIGRFLSKSCLPSLPGQPYLFFDRPKTLSERDVEITAGTMWQPMRTYQEHLSELFYAFVKNANARNEVLKWIGDCLMENRGKNKEWSSHNPLTALMYVGDGFLLNLNIILLHLARPFSEPNSPKLLKINPFYTVSKDDNVHLKGLENETPMIVRDEQSVRHSFPNNFITEIFFLSHLSYSLSVHRLHRTLLKINEELSRIQTAYQEANRVRGSNDDGVRRLEEAMDRGMSAFLNIKTVLNEPRLLEYSHSFFIATSSWLVHIAACSNIDEYDKGIEPLRSLPLKVASGPIFGYLPEFIVENVVNFLTFLGRFNLRLFETLTPPVNEYVTFILVFMGDASRLRNPHLRAGLAEGFEAMLPNKSSSARTMNSSFAEQIFTDHPLILHLPRVLLDVFVSIELTGQAVAFEQKFNYRRPMYEILEFFWKFDAHRAEVKKLALYAEEHIDDAEAPLFLRFINLLMNDANFLLDEALTQMARLRENQEAIDRGDWATLPEQQRQDLENTFRHTGQIARYMNIMGLKTLIILDMITHEIQSIFCYPAISERLAAMLNYFLLHLVGPKRRNLKVRDLNEYQFDPSKLVAKVTDIYLNFAQHDQFCASVCKDGMSYNEQLFPQAVDVLEKIRYSSEKIQEFLRLVEHIKDIADQQKEDDAVYDDAPDEYLDPITSTLMIEPVMLPGSRQIVDRATIARHLLSDQTDPFNRMPLKMQDCIPQPELKRTIEQWKASRRPS